MHDYDYHKRIIQQLKTKIILNRKIMQIIIHILWVHPASIILQDVDNRFVSDIEKQCGIMCCTRWIKTINWNSLVWTWNIDLTAINSNSAVWWNIYFWLWTQAQYDAITLKRSKHYFILLIDTNRCK